jgi:chaperonin GroES
MSIQPLGDRLLVEVKQTETTTASGIVLPDSAKEKKAEGTIIAIGNGEKITALKLSVGETVLFGKYAGDEIETEDKKKEFKMLSDKEVLAVIK